VTAVPAAADAVVAAMPLAAHVARRYRHRGEALEELEQVAYLALAEAAHRFDPDRGHDFLAFAVVWVDGALRHHFRDRTWMVRPPRRLVEARPAVAAAAARAVERRVPVTAYVAAATGLPADDVERVRRLGSAYAPFPIDQVAWERPSARDPLDQVEDRLVLAPALRALEVRERRVVVRRFRDGWSQSEIARELGVSQMQVSRILRRALHSMRGELAPAAS
jgi:RNA polymerase sigma-B factor